MHKPPAVFLRISLQLLLGMCPGILPAAPFISEFLASNGTTIVDEDGQASDWIEVHNPDAQPVTLAGYHLTDDPDTLTKWTFPDVTLGSRGYMIVWASGKDRLGTELHTNFGLSGNGEYLALVAPDGKTILSEFSPKFPPQILDTSYGGGLATTRATVLAPGSAARWRVPEGDTAGWTNADFDDTGWNSAASGIGFGYGDLVGVDGDVKGAMQAINGSIYTRFPFEISDPGSVVSVTMRLKFEDGFVAFLNGFEIASFNAPEDIGWNSIATDVHPDSEAEQFVDFEIPFGGHLLDGRNVLAIQGLNATVGGSDLLILPELTVQMQSGEVMVGYLLEPTPGAVNTSSFSSPPVPPSFSARRGYYDAPFELTLSTDDPAADIFYTTDGSLPSVSDGKIYTVPLAISKTTVVRAVTVRDGKPGSQAATHTYLFTADILEQSGFNGRNNRLITSDDVYGPLMVESLRAIPAVCLSAERRLPNANESETSIELFDPAGREQGFQIDCGIKLVGGASTGSPKNNFRLYFRGIYGATKLRYPLFEGHPYSDNSAEEFDILQLRSGSHDNFFWLALPSNPPVGNRHGDAQYVRNRWIADMQFLMGQESLHGRFVQLYVNGQYHGLYHLHERSMPGYLASYLGGAPEDYHYTNSARTGSDHGGGDRWSVTWSQMKSSISSYEDAKEMIDVENLADYMLLNFYAGNTWDWTAQHNWMAGGPKEPGRGGWKFFCWDSDIMLQDVRNNAVAIDVPDGVFHRLLDHDDFRVLMRDRIYRYCFNDGLLTPDKVAAVYNYRMEEIFVPLVAETARWQPASATRLPWDRDGEWMTEWNHFKEVWFPQRTEILLDQLRATRVRGAVLYPVEAPEFLRRGGLVAPGYAPRLTSASGAVYYTTDGSDPRLPGGGIAPGARAFAGGTRPVTLVPLGSIWRFPEDGVDLGTDWRAGDFDDSQWDEGAGQLGYGERDEVTVIESSGSGALKSPTNYFRLAFDIASPEKMSGLRIELLRDDGAVVYLNGSEVVRDNLPEGMITFETLAVDAISGAAESEFVTFDVPAGLLVRGRNLLAVEVHQNSPGSSDLSFDLSLSAKEATGSAEIVINSPTTIRTRALEGDEWSALNEATFSVTTSPPASMANVMPTEIHYNPYSDADVEFLEFKNVSDLPVDFSNVVVSGAIDYTFPTGSLLPAAEYMVVVGELAKFNALHQSAASPWAADGAIMVVGPWSGKLSNSGEALTVTAADGSLIFDFKFGDSGAWPERADGHGSSLELRQSNVVLPGDPVERNAYFSDPNHWQSSIAYFGSPGTASAAAPGIVINELLADGQPVSGDRIELYNPTNVAIDISGWLLSDDSADPGRFKIPAGSVVPPGGFLTISETEGLFGLSSRGGDEVFLVRADAEGNPLQFSDQVDFGPSARGESFGRWPDGAGSLYPMKLATFGELNITDGNAPRIGPVVISEVHYNPDGPDENLEFVTLLNTGTSDENLTLWQLRGEVDFDFPSGTVLGPGASVRIVPFSPLDSTLASSFSESYGFDASIPLAGPWMNGAKLNDGGGAVRLYRRIAVAEPDDVRMLIEDSVRYSDEAGWPEAADGSGAWLVRANPLGIGDNGGNWRTSTATGGNSFTQWTKAAFPDGTPADAMLPAADFDDDGITNFAEYAFLLDPSAADPDELLTATVHGDGGIEISHLVRTDDRTLSYQVRGSSDLINWFDDVQRFTIESEAVVTNVSARRAIRYAEQPSTMQLRFFRIEVTGSQ